MKKSIKMMALLLALCMALSLVFVACDTETCPPHIDVDGDGVCDKCGNDMPKPVSISATAAKDTISYNSETGAFEEIAVTVTVENATDSTYTWSYSQAGVVKVENNVVKVILDADDMTLDVYVVITATSNEDTTQKASLPITVKAPTKAGQVGELTSAMIEEIGNSSITVTGTLTDYYMDYNASYNNEETSYDMLVKMSDGVWYGEYNATGSTEVRSNHYIKGSNVVTDWNGDVGNELLSVGINMYNEVAATAVKNYNSISATWQSQHLYNHLGQLNINKFEYDAQTGMYKYNYSSSSTEDLYLLTYLSYSLTPLLEDTLDSLYLVVEDGKITKLIAQTALVNYPEDDESPDYGTYTIIELTFSDVGTTVVADPEIYSSDNYTSILEEALTKMAAATNYSFSSVETSISAPSYDESDYEISSIATTSTNKNKPLANSTSSKGEVGLKGWVVADGDSPAILLCKTGQYTATLDGKDYYTTYYGYKQTEAGYYDAFEFVYEKDSSGTVTDYYYQGTKKYSGNVMDAMPSFTFSANLFKCLGYTTSNGKKVYTFVLQENNISRDIAMQLGIYYASDSESSLSVNFTIKVTEGEGITEVKYPYSLVSGTYTGYITTTYYNVGTTVMPTGSDGGDIFDNYVARVIPADWTQVNTRYYHPDLSTTSAWSNTATDVVLSDIFGSKASGMLPYTALFNVFDDNLTDAFFDWKESGTDVDGNTTYIKYISITATTDDYDENSKISTETFTAIMNKMITEFAKYGYELDNANTDISGGSTGYGSKYIGFINNDAGIQIHIESNGTRYFFFDFYNAGDYKLNKTQG